MPLTQQAALRKDRNTGKATMEHRHFATIAAILRDMPELETHYGRARYFATQLAKTNPRFDRARFLRACGVEG